MKGSRADVGVRCNMNRWHAHQRGGRQVKKAIVKKHKACVSPKIDMSWAARYTAKTNPSKIRCTLCKNKKFFDGWDKFADHLRQTHAIRKIHLQGTYIGAQLQQSKIAISIEEVSCVNVDPFGDETRFKCLLCEDSRSIHSKGNASRHLFRQHNEELVKRGIPLESLSQWIVIREGNAQKQGRQRKLSLTAALQCHDGGHTERQLLLL